MNAPYPPASEAVDNHLASAIDALRGDVQAGFARTDATLRDVVLKGEFNATIQRLDARDEHLETAMNSGFTGLRADMASQFAGLKTEDDRKTSRTRWFTGTAVTIGALASSVVFGVISNLR